MSRVIFSPAAITDIDGIWDYIAETWGVYQAEHYTDDIRDTCNVLAAGEKKCRPVNVREGYLKYAVGKHLVFFKTPASVPPAIMTSYSLAGLELKPANPASGAR